MCMIMSLLKRLFLFSLTQNIHLVETWTTFLISTVITIILMKSNRIANSFLKELELIVNFCLSKSSNMSKQNLILKYKHLGLSAWISLGMCLNKLRYVYIFMEKNYGPWCLYLGVGTGRKHLQWVSIPLRATFLTEGNSSMEYYYKILIYKKESFLHRTVLLTGCFFLSWIFKIN